MRVRYTARANQDLGDVVSYIESNNRVAAEAIGVAIKAAIARLQAFPLIGSETDTQGIYMIVTHPHRYLVFYRIDGETLIIRNIRHPARRRPS